MTETQAINLCSDTDFLKRVTFSLAKNARTIHAETAGPRTVLASKVILAPQSYAQPVAYAVLSSLTAAALAAINTAADVTQSQIDTQVLAVWDAFA